MILLVIIYVALSVYFVFVKKEKRYGALFIFVFLFPLISIITSFFIIYIGDLVFAAPNNLNYIYSFVTKFFNLISRYNVLFIILNIIFYSLFIFLIFRKIKVNIISKFIIIYTGLFFLIMAYVFFVLIATVSSSYEILGP